MPPLRQACNAFTGTPLARLRHREHWSCFAQPLIDEPSVRAAAAQCGIDKNAAWRWRQRFLVTAAGHRAEYVGSIVEADEPFFLESFKGTTEPSSGQRSAAFGCSCELAHP